MARVWSVVWAQTRVSVPMASMLSQVVEPTAMSWCRTKALWDAIDGTARPLGIDGDHLHGAVSLTSNQILESVSRAEIEGYREHALALHDGKQTDGGWWCHCVGHRLI